jgi:hypothetical protein
MAAIAPDDVYEKTRRHFNEKELADLTLAVQKPVIDSNLAH